MKNQLHFILYLAEKSVNETSFGELTIMPYSIE
jgi:hypothetical protein